VIRDVIDAAGSGRGLRVAATGLLLWPPLLATAHFGGIDKLGWSLLWLLLLAAVGFAFLRSSGHPAFGPANTLTLLRFGLVLLLFERAGCDELDPAGSWPLFAIAAAALLLDAADGWTARRFACASPFGERFDIEADTAFLFTAALMLVLSGRAGFWVLTAGLLRPLFLLAGALHPPLAAPLARSRRRAFVCGLAATLLTLALLPPLPAGVPAALAGLATAALLWSFAVDIRALLARR
jgi:phosphatidylglycerophosphate synthase